MKQISPPRSLSLHVMGASAGSEAPGPCANSSAWRRCNRPRWRCHTAAPAAAGVAEASEGVDPRENWGQI